MRLHGGHALHSLNTAAGIISGVDVVDNSGTVRPVSADFYISAVPVDRAIDLLRTQELLRLDPQLDAIKDLRVHVVSMEGANQGGRIAAQAVLDAAGSNTERVVRYDYYTPPQLDPLKAMDAQRFAAGQPNIFEVR